MCKNFRKFLNYSLLWNAIIAVNDCIINSPLQQKQTCVQFRLWPLKGLQYSYTYWRTLILSAELTLREDHQLLLRKRQDCVLVVVDCKEECTLMSTKTPYWLEIQLKKCFFNLPVYVQGSVLVAEIIHINQTSRPTPPTAHILSEKLIIFCLLLSQCQQSYDS